MTNHQHVLEQLHETFKLAKFTGNGAFNIVCQPLLFNCSEFSIESLPLPLSRELAAL